MSDEDRERAMLEIARSKAEVRDLVKERSDERATMTALGSLGVHVTRQELLSAKAHRTASAAPGKKSRRTPDAVAPAPTAEQVDALWRDLEALVRAWLPDWMEGLSLGDDGALVRVIARTLRALGPLRAHTADATRLQLKEGMGRLGEEMLYLTDRVIPLRWRRDGAVNPDADLAYLKARRSADLRAAALRRVAERLHHTESLILLMCGRTDALASPIPYAYILAEVEGARPHSRPPP